MKKILLKTFMFLIAIIGVLYIVTKVLGGEEQIVNITYGIIIVLSVLAAADITTFLIMLFLSHCTWKKNWKSFCSLLIATFGLAVIWVLLRYLVPDLPIASRITYILAELTVLASGVNLVCNIFYLIFGNDKLKVRWKLFIFFMIITGICAGLWLIGLTIGAEIVSVVASNIGLLSLSAAVINILIIVADFIFSRNTNIFFKIFIFTLTLSGAIAAYSFLPLLLGYPLIQRIIFLAVIAVFLFAVIDFIIILFRVIFLDRRFMYCEQKNPFPFIDGNAVENAENIAEEVIVNTVDDNH